MKTLFKISLIFILTLALSAFVTQPGLSQAVCDEGTPHIEMMPFPSTNSGGLEAQYYYAKTYGPYYPSNYVYVPLHCGLNNIKEVDPCNPWILTFYIKYFEEDFDMVKVMKPTINALWDTTVCQDFRFNVTFPSTWNDATDYYDPNIPNSGKYYDTVIMKVTMIPHAGDFCIPDTVTHPPQPWSNGFPGYICGNWDTIYNWNCWQDCLNERITFRCIDSCEIPNMAICNIEWDKALPVELNSFVSIIQNEDVILNWTTTTELNNSGFGIERKSDGIWSNIGFVGGKGNSEIPTDYSFIDRKLNSGSYNYRLKQTDYNGNFEYYELSNTVNIGVPEKFSLSPNYPNPFNPTTKIDFALPKDENVMLKVYDISGREMVTVLHEFRTAGYYTITFNASNLASGMYYYKLTAGNNTAVNKMVVLK